MNSITIDVDSRAVAEAFRRAPRTVNKKLQDWTDRTSAIAERRVKTQEVPVDTARLQNSIHISRRPLNNEIKPNTVYMYWVHDGAKSPHAPRHLRNSSYRGNPFMTRTFRYTQPIAEREGRELLSEIVRSI